MRRPLAVPALIVCGFLFLQIAWIITIPPFRGSDEVDHAYRAAAVARGEWRAGPAAENGRGNLVEVPRSLVAAAHDQCEALDYMKPDNCNPVEDTSEGNVLVASSAGAYYPPFYWLAGTVALPFDGAGALYAMRVCAALLCLLFLGLAAWSLNKFQSRWPLATLIVAASPVLIYSTTVVAPNGLEMAAALSLWSSLLALTNGAPSLRSQRGLLAVAVLSAVVMGSLRLFGPLFILLTVAVVAFLNWRNLKESLRHHRWTWATGSLLVGLAVALFLLWTRSPVDPSVASSTSGPAPPEGPTYLLLSNVVLWPVQSIAAFPYRNQMAPMIVYVVVALIVIGLISVALRVGSLKQRSVLMGALTVALVLPFVITIATLESIGVIWQGRYGLPFAVGFILISGVIIGSVRTSTLSRVPAALAALPYLASVAACLIKVRADEIGQNAASVEDPAWHVPSAPLLVGLVAIGFGFFWYAVTRCPHADEVEGRTSPATHARIDEVDASDAG